MKTSIEYSGEKQARWEPSGHHYILTIENDGKKVEVDFWDSFHNAQNGIEPNIDDALHCWLSDITAYMDYPDMDEFASQFGYKKPSHFIAAYQGCKRAMKQAQRLGLDENDIYAQLEELQEKGY